MAYYDFVYITCKDKKEAKKISLVLVKKRLAGCYNIFPIESIYPVRNSGKDVQKTKDKRLVKLGRISNGVYWWKGKIKKDKEAVLIVKTLRKNFKKIEKAVKELHSYSVPCILEILIGKGNKEYLDWIKS